MCCPMLRVQITCSWRGINPLNTPDCTEYSQHPARSWVRIACQKYVISPLANVRQRAAGAWQPACQPPFPQIGPMMKPERLLLTVALLSAVGVTPAMADCQIPDAKLEQ